MHIKNIIGEKGQASRGSILMGSRAFDWKSESEGDHMINSSVCPPWTLRYRCAFVRSAHGHERVFIQVADQNRLQIKGVS